MRHFAWIRWLIGVLLPTVVAGCAENAMVLKGQLTRVQEERMAMSRQLQELQQHNSLDSSNQELESLLAQANQKVQLLNDESGMLREQLGGVTSQLAKVRQDREATQQQAQALTASMRSRGAVTIKPNNSYLETLPRFEHRDFVVRRDGDVIRVELPSGVLFQPGNAQLRPDGVRLIAAVAAELARAYRKQMIGVEGHTDSDPVRNATWRSNTQLSVGQATAVYEILLTQSELGPDQLFVVGHGANHPVVSNATAAGKQRNRRIELVIYPEQSR